MYDTRLELRTPGPSAWSIVVCAGVVCVCAVGVGCTVGVGVVGVVCVCVVCVGIVGVSVVGVGVDVVCVGVVGVVGAVGVCVGAVCAGAVCVDVVCFGDGTGSVGSVGMDGDLKSEVTPSSAGPTESPPVTDGGGPPVVLEVSADPRE